MAIEKPAGLDHRAELLRLLRVWGPHLSPLAVKLAELFLQRGYFGLGGLPLEFQRELREALQVNRARLGYALKRAIELGLIREEWRGPGVVWLVLNLDAVPPVRLQSGRPRRPYGRRKRARPPGGYISERFEAAVDERAIDLTQRVPTGLLEEIAAELSCSPVTLRHRYLPELRRSRGVWVWRERREEALCAGRGMGD
jgi:hypothetical protein